MAFAQGYKVDGTILDADDRSTMPGALVKLTYLSDTTKWKGIETDNDGKFQLTDIPDGQYQMEVIYLGYKSGLQKVKVAGADKHLGAVFLERKPTSIKDVPIVAKENRVKQKDDTTEYNANAYKVNTDASAEDLVTKMPGISSNNGTVTAHGETVQQVYVDGKEFFGQDATLALKNLPAEIIDKVQVFDKWTDQAQFTGFDDGNSTKAINITTKRGKSNGVFGKVFAGYGYIDNSVYSVGAGVNWFNGDRRISLIGMSNNVNIQNFATQDLLGVIGSSTQRQGSGFGSGGGGRRGGGGGGGGGGSVNNFLIGSQPGISTTHSAGFNYIDTWGKKKKVKLSASYFFNLQDNITQTSIARQYFTTTTDTASTYSEKDSTKSRNINHRISLRLEYAIDSFNKFIFTDRFNFQKNNQGETTFGQTFLNPSDQSAQLESQTANGFQMNTLGYNFTGDILFQHKFKKVHRTFSADLGYTVNNKSGNTWQTSNTLYAIEGDSVMLNQLTPSLTNAYTASLNLAYTEPVGKSGMLQFNVTPSNTWNNSDGKTFNFDPTLNSYSLLDTILSSQFSDIYMADKAGVNYRYGIKNFNLTLGVNAQYALLSGQEDLPDDVYINRTYINVLPNAMIAFKTDSGSSLRIFYRTSTNPPSITQLSNVVNNNNPLLLSAGNPDLRQAYTHSLVLRYGLTNKRKAQSFFAFLSASYTQNYVGSSTFIAGKDTTVDSQLLHSGSQFTQPVNINGNASISSFLTFGFPIDLIRCNMNLNGGFTFNTTPGLVNSERNVANTYAPTAGFVLGSNINTKIDFTISYTANYNVVENTLQKSANNNYFTHTGNVKFNWEFWKGFVFNTSLQNTLYEGIAQGFNTDIFLWNLALGYKFLKDKSLDVRMGVNDVLNQNENISRTITDTYVEDDKTQVLKRYWMLTITYTLRYFNNKKA